MGASKKDIQTPVNCFFPTKTTYSLSFNRIRHFSNSQILARLLSLFLMIENKGLFDGAVCPRACLALPRGYLWEDEAAVP
jgi:hypothetical protein